jgi:hypothetical protein
MSETEAGKPILASDNTFHGAVPQAVRYGATALAAIVASHYFNDGNVTAAVVAFAGCVIPYGWGLVERIRRNLTIKKLVRHVPDEVARFK